MDRQHLQSAKPDLLGGWETEAFDLWFDDQIVRGKGLTQAQCRVNQYAHLTSFNSSQNPDNRFWLRRRIVRCSWETRPRKA